MANILVCWIGRTDLRASTGEIDGPGPIADAVTVRAFDHVRLMADFDKKEVSRFLRWLAQKSHAAVQVDYHRLNSPTDFEEIFPACRKTLKALQAEYPDQLRLTFHISPGTPHMAATWIILSETEFPARLIDSSPEQGVKDVHLPLSLTAEWLPSYIRNRDAKLERAAPELPPQAAQFDNIVRHSEVMNQLVYKASKVAPRTVPVLLEGESGTGKELFARAIHEASLRARGPFVPVNCGAIPADLVESTLFGHEKGAFTGAHSTQPGKFEQAHGGTLFLDELGELPREAQVRFLRILEDKQVWRLGAKKPVAVDARIVAATNRSLLVEVAEGRFREDLFYRLAVAVLKLPPLRHRGEDIRRLIRYLLQQVNEESRDEPGYRDKKLSPEGEKIMIEHSWPGNVRELLNTLRRLAVWSDDSVISAQEVREGLLNGPDRSRRQDPILARSFGEGFDLASILNQVERHYVEKAWLQSGRRKKDAASLLGMSSYQTLTKRLEKYGLDK